MDPEPSESYRSHWKETWKRTFSCAKRSKELKHCEYKGKGRENIELKKRSKE